jgi:hypothetical protein
VQLDGCRIPAEQYDALLGRGFSAQVHSNAAISPAVWDPIKDVTKQQEECLPPTGSSPRATRSQRDESEHGCSRSQPVTEALKEEDSCTGLVVDPSLVDVQSSVDSEDELHHTVITQDSPLDRAGQGEAEQYSSFSALAVLQQAQQHQSSTSTSTSFFHEHHAPHTGAPVSSKDKPLTVPPSRGIGTFGTRQLSVESTSNFMCVMKSFAASGGSRSQRRNSRASHFSSENSTTVLVNEESSTDPLALPAAISDHIQTTSSTCAALPLPSEKSMIQLQSTSSRNVSKLQEATARHERRLNMILTGQASFATDIAPPSFHHCPAVLDDSASLRHALSLDALNAALKYNPLFSVIDAAVKLQVDLKDNTAAVCAFVLLLVFDDFCTYCAFPVAFRMYVNTWC